MSTAYWKMAVQISKKRKFVSDGIFKAELNEFLTRELAEDGYSGVEVRVTPTRTEIIILATRTQNVLGEKGRRIRELTAVVQKRFGFPEGSVELYAEKVATRGLCAIAQAESLRYKLLGGLAVRRACYGVLRFIMESGAKGCEVVVSGKLRGQRAKSMKFVDGLMIHSGDPVNYYVDTAVRHVLLRQGVLGIKVKIMLPWDPSGKIGPKKPLPDHVSIVEPKEENLPTTPISEQKGAKPEVPVMPQGAPVFTSWITWRTLCFFKGFQLPTGQTEIKMSLPDYKSPEKHPAHAPPHSPVVQLNVGGHLFSTLLSTLRKHPDSQLAEMFSGQPKIRTDEQGCYFIDRDGSHFGAVLQFLRSEQLPTQNIQEVYKEAVHYNIKPLIKCLGETPQLFGELVGRQQFLSRVPHYKENIEVLIRIARAEAIATRCSTIMICVLRTEEDLGFYDNAINNLGADKESVVTFGPWKAEPSVKDLLDCIKMDIESQGYKTCGAGGGVWCKKDAVFVYRRLGDSALLPCTNLVSSDCSFISWTFYKGGQVRYTHEVTGGRVEVDSDKFSRVSVTPNCSLQLHELKEDDAGSYVCLHNGDIMTDVYLSLLTVTALSKVSDLRHGGSLALSCILFTYYDAGSCKSYSNTFSLSWVNKDGSVLPKDTRYEVIVSTRCNITLVTKLQREDKNRKWRCQVNTTGNNRAVFQDFTSAFLFESPSTQDVTPASAVDCTVQLPISRIVLCVALPVMVIIVGIFTWRIDIPHEETPAKKLRLSKPSKSAALHIDLCKATNSTDALQYLLQFARKPVEAESVEGVVRILLEHYYKETDNSVRLKIASLLGLLSKTQGFSPDCIVDDTINALSNEKSHQVLAQLLDTLLVIGSQLPESPTLRQRLVEVACKHLSDTYFGVRNKCLQLLGCLGMVDTPLNKDEGLGTSIGGVRDVQSIISDYFGDQDPRVRTAAIKATLQLHERGMKIHQIIYEQACRLLSDDYEQVRSAAVQMVWVLSQLYPESIVPIPSSNEEIRLVDDAFGKISHMVSDGSWMVRVQAAKTLGSMLQVSPHFLEQTLDKKLMSDLRRKRTAHERAKELFASGEFSSGRKWADDAPKEKLDTNTVNLIASGACGAFVHGLEDEMFEVRIAAVEALCQLARSSPSFAEKCLDFLVDMFNDEIEEVRLQSIHVLREISTHITLREDQLDTVLAVLEDSSRDIREAVHELLCYTNVSTKECIQLALLELLKNLNKYPTDRNSVWKCLKFVGSRHPTLVLPLVSELLSTHPYFDTPEPDMDDPAYIAVLVLVFNAARSCPTMPALFSDHTFRHYAYLRDSLSHLVPPLRLPGRKQVYGLDSVDSGCGSGSVESAQLFLQQSLNRVSTIQNLEAPGAQDLLDFTIRDLQRLGELQTELAGAADFCATYLHCQLLLIKALQEKLWNMAVPLCPKQNVTATAAAQQILEETYKLEFLYCGLESRQVATIHHVRLQAKALQLVLTARTRQGSVHTLKTCTDVDDICVHTTSLNVDVFVNCLQV
ncbi:hypothetical protein INR49_016762 [Caranx melampygus]|nr:hypothetical protein INR49_016762 [Caranx melampygus]